MGYNTRFKLTTSDIDDLVQLEIEDKIKTITGYDYSYMLGSDDIKWYDYHDDMIKLSKLFPEVLFKIDAVGDGAGDFWQAYYKNGKSVEYTAKIVFPEFNESDLK